MHRRHLPQHRLRHRELQHLDWKLQDPAGAIRRISLGSDNDLSSGELAPGGTVSGQVCFDAKSGAQGTWTVIYEGGIFGSENLSWVG